jgi:hypothetical protein
MGRALKHIHKQGIRHLPSPDAAPRDHLKTLAIAYFSFVQMGTFFFNPATKEQQPFWVPNG